MQSPPRRNRRLEWGIAAVCAGLLILVFALDRIPGGSLREPHTWISGPVLIQLDSLAGYTSFETAWSLTPDLIVYADGTVVGTYWSRTSSGSYREIRQGKLDSEDICGLLYQIESTGYFEYDLSDYTIPEVTDLGNNLVDVGAWRENRLEVYGLYQFMSGSGSSSNRGLGDTAQLLLDLRKTPTMPYSVERVALMVGAQRSTNQSAPIWPLSSIRLADVAGELGRDGRGEVVLVGEAVSEVMDLFRGDWIGSYREGADLYTVTIRPLLPYEIYVRSTGWGEYSIFDDSPEVEMSCSPSAAAWRLTPPETPTSETTDPDLLRAPLELIFNIGSRNAPGQLSLAGALTIDPDGNLLVADNGNNRLQRFSPDGELLEILPLEDSWPSAMAYASDGTLILVDWIENEVEVRTPQGELLRTYTDWPAPEAGYTDPRDHIELLALGPGGEIFVAESPGDRIIQLDAQGNFISIWHGPDDRPFEDISDLRTDPSGNLYIAMNDPSRIVVRALDGEVKEISTEVRWVAPTADGSFFTGNYWTGIKFFDSDWTLSYQWELEDVRNIVSTANRSLFVLLDTLFEQPENAIIHYAADGSILASFAKSSLQPGQFDGNAGFSVSPAGDVWIVGTIETELLKPHTYSLIHVDPSGAPLATFDNLGGEPFSCQEYTLAALQDGSVIIADPCSAVFLHLGQENQVLDRWGSQGLGEGEFSLIQSIFLSPDSNSLYIVDSGNGRLVQISLSGEEIRTWSADAFGVKFLQGAAESESGSFFLLDGATNEIVGWSENNGETARWPLPDQSDCVRSIAIDSRLGRIYIGGCRSSLYVFDLAGKYLGELSVSDASGVTVQVGPEGEVYRSAGYHEIQVFAPTDP